MKGQVSLEYLIIMAAVLLISVVSIVLVQGSTAANSEEISILSCQSAARECALLKRANDSIECSFCAEECVNAGEEELYPGIISCCMVGNVDSIFKGSDVICTPEVEGCVDGDGDGFNVYDAVLCPFGDDCNDMNPEIYPGQVENCSNWFDDNCDGLSGCGEDPVCDTDIYCLSLVCTDLDFDNFWAIDGSDCLYQTDCNDADDSINPDADENCTDEIDNDCDEAVDCFDFDCMGTVDCPIEIADQVESACNSSADLTLGDEGILFDLTLFEGSSTYGIPNCCGNNEDEWYLQTSGSYACCNEINDCVYLGDCYNNGYLKGVQLCAMETWKTCTSPLIGKDYGTDYCCAGTTADFEWNETPGTEDSYAGGCLDGLDNNCDGLIDFEDVINCGLCGNGEVDTGEFCDDGYRDECGTCNADCTAFGSSPTCGDGILCPEFEFCDDGYNDDCGSCNLGCDGAGTGSTCGDGVVCPEFEVCDDGYQDECGDCNANCDGSGFGADSCGDGMFCPSQGEQCDDGNLIDGDGCSSTCEIE